VSLVKDVQKCRWRRKQRVRNQVRNLRSDRPRVSVFRSLNHIYGQIIDDHKHHTLVSHSSLSLSDAKGTKSDIAHRVGKELAEKAYEKNISEVIFDRGAHKYHGRVAAFAQGLREGGLQL